MSFRSVSRRRLLTASGGCFSIVLAGCSEFGRSDAASETVDDGGTTIESRIESTRGREALFVRFSRDSPFVYPNEEVATDDSALPLDRAFFITDEDDAAALWINADTSEADDVREFVDATDFTEESVLVDQRSIDDCYRRHLVAVDAAAAIRRSYCRELKSPTTPCEAERTVMEAVFVRVHRPYENGPSNRSASERGSCSDGHTNDHPTANETTEGSRR